MRLTLATVRPLPWLLSLALAMGSCLIGATTRYVLLGKRAEWLASDTALPTYFLAWVLINSSNVVPGILTSRPGYLAMTVLEMVHKARTITGAVDLTVKTFAEPVWVGPIVIGALSSCTGSFYRVIVERVMLGDNGSTEFTKPTILGLKMGVYLSLFYYFSTDPYGVFFSAPWLSKEVATLIMMYYLIATGLTVVLLGPIAPFPVNLLERILPSHLIAGHPFNDLNVLPPPVYYPGKARIAEAREAMIKRHNVLPSLSKSKSKAKAKKYADEDEDKYANYAKEFKESMDVKDAKDV